jgi:hypothetical protein
VAEAKEEMGFVSTASTVCPMADGAAGEVPAIPMFL